jgi:hypothetical protein
MIVEVEAVEQVVGAVAAAKGHDGGGVRIGEGCVEIGESLLRSSGKVERLAQESVGPGFGA